MATSDKFAVELDEVNDEEFELRIKARGKKQHRNFTGYDQKRSAVVYGHRHATVHGSFVDSEDQPQDGSLIILDWHFLSRDPSKRFKFVRINVVFSGREGCSPWEEPAVYQMAPRGSFALHKTGYTEERKRELEASLGAEFGGSASLKGVYGLTKSTTIGDKIRITGQPYLDFGTGTERDPDRLNAIEWQFFENESQKSGLPTYIRTAMLLSRETDDEFTATFTIRAKVGGLTDVGTKLRKVLGRKDEDDPITFVPSMKEKTIYQDKIDELHKVSLQDQCIFVMDHEVPEAADDKKVEDDQGLAEANDAGVSVGVSINEEASI